MLTASYMTPVRLKDSWMPGENATVVDLLMVDIAGGPIDAPECLAGGCHYRTRAMSYDGEYGLPYGILRDGV